MTRAGSLFRKKVFFLWVLYSSTFFIQRGLQYFLLLETKIFGKQTRVTMITWRVCEGDELVQPFLSCSYIAVIYCTTCLRHLWTQHRNSARSGQPRNTNGLRRYDIHLSHNTQMKPCWFEHSLRQESLAGMQDKRANASYLWNLEVEAQAAVYSEWSIITGQWINHCSKCLLGTALCDDPTAV